MNNTDIMIENISLVLTTVATLSAAIAAWFSYRISKNSLNFQKNYAKNQSLVNELRSVSNKARTILSLISNPLDAPDNQFALIEPLFAELKANIQHFSNIGIIDYSSLKIKNVNSLGEMIDQMAKNNAYLTEIIEVLERKVNEIFN